MADTNRVRPPRPVGAFVAVVVLAAIVYACSFIQFPQLNLIPDYGTWFQQCADGNVLAKLAYMFSDWGDPTYQKTALGGILMIVGCFIALYTGKNSKCTFGVAYGSGKLVPILIAQIIASGGSVFLYSSLFQAEGAASGIRSSRLASWASSWAAPSPTSSMFSLSPPGACPAL